MKGFVEVDDSDVKSSAGQGLPLEEDTLRCFLDLLRTRTGLNFEKDKHVYFCNRLGRRMSEIGMTEPREYLKLIEADSRGIHGEFQNLIQVLTIGETYLFRDPRQFSALLYDALPPLVNDVLARGRREVNIWCAGCSTGEEAYSLAVVVQMHRERLNHGFEGTILGTDINLQTLEEARRGRY